VRVESSREIPAPPSEVWPLISDPTRLPHVIAALARWEIAGDIPEGLGARYRVLMQVGSAPVGGLVEIVEFDEPRDIAWTSITGVDQRGRWRLRQVRPLCTRVTLRLAYSAPGGLLGLVADRIAAPLVRRNLRRTLECLRDAVVDLQRTRPRPSG
jgi:uncharacterized membrane protein